MRINKKLSTSEILVSIVVNGMHEVKAKEIISLDLRNIENSVCDFFIVCHGSSYIHSSAIAESIEEETNKTIKEKPIYKEGLKSKDWILLDYGNVVAHVFLKETRNYYNLEKLWGDAKTQLINEIS